MKNTFLISVDPHTTHSDIVFWYNRKVVKVETIKMDVIRNCTRVIGVSIFPELEKADRVVLVIEGQHVHNKLIADSILSLASARGEITQAIRSVIQVLTEIELEVVIAPVFGNRKRRKPWMTAMLRGIPEKTTGGKALMLARQEKGFKWNEHTASAYAMGLWWLMMQCEVNG